jgi:hypothetical protein
VIAGIKRWITGNPRVVFLVVAGAVLLGLFLGVVAPLFATSGNAMADLSGVIPASAPAGRQVEIDVSVDNTGFSVVGQLCVSAVVQGPLTPVNAIFQNVDKEPFVNGTACGGELTSQSSAPVQLFFLAGAAGSAQLVLAPMDGKRTIGAALSGTVSVGGP